MRAVSDPADAAAVLRFWLGTVGPGGWYATDPEVDRACAERFGGLLADGAAGRLRPWQATPTGALALCILLDQFARNIHRGTAAAFATDARGLATAKAALARGDDLRVEEPERQFFYLPLMHSERLPDQCRSVRLCLLRMPRTGADNLDHAIRHREVIRRFGRFPSRNAALGRADTAAERAYRASGGYMG